MRKLQTGQSVVFCVPTEIAFKIRKNAALQFGEQITIPDVLAWSISQTTEDIQRSMTLWANQGVRYIKHKQIWDSARTDDSFDMTHDGAEKFLEDEAMSLERRYSPVVPKRANPDSSTCCIYGRLTKFTEAVVLSESLQGEQEREVAPEVEEERHMERPSSAKAEQHKIHGDVRSFVNTGVLPSHSPAFLPAFDILRTTTAARFYDSGSYPEGILVTRDFARTIKTSSLKTYLDAYQRSVQWIVTSTGGGNTNVTHMVVISPYEACLLLPAIRKTCKVTLHIYSPRVNEEFESLDHLGLYTEGKPFDNIRIPDDFVSQLNVFAGQVYFNSYAAYVKTCKYLGVRSELTGGNAVDGDGFILRPGEDGSKFRKSPIPILRTLVNTIRRNNHDITKTHVGKMLGGVILDQSLFDTKFEDTSS